jgi:hypothetical protein
MQGTQKERPLTHDLIVSPIFSAGVQPPSKNNSACGDTAQGIAWIDHRIRDYPGTGTMQDLLFLLALKAEAYTFGSRRSEALEGIREAVALVERSGGRRWLAELRRLRRIFSRLWVRTTPKLNFHLRSNQNGEGQKSVSLQKTAEGKPRLTNLGSRSMRKVR